MNTRRSFLASLAKLAGVAVAAPVALRKLAKTPSLIDPMEEARLASVAIRRSSAGIQSFQPGMVKCLDVGEELVLLMPPVDKTDWYFDEGGMHFLPKSSRA